MYGSRGIVHGGWMDRQKKWHIEVGAPAKNWQSSNHIIIKTKTAGGRGLKNMGFPGVLQKYNVEIPGINKNRKKTSRGDQKEINWNSHGSWFLVLKIPMDFLGWSFNLSEISMSKVTNLKFPEVFPKKVCHQTPSVHIFLE